MTSSSVRQLSAGPTLADQAYEELRRRIIDGTYLRGQQLTERALAKDLGVSPTPVREAIRRLEHERLLSRTTRLRVAAPTPSELRQLRHVEAVLRGAAARFAALNATDRQLEQIARTHAKSLRVPRRGRPVADVARDVLTLTRRFHALIDEASGVPTLIDMIATAGAFDWTVRLRTATDLGRQYPARAGLDEHQLIVDALRSRDAERAEELMRAHTLRTGEQFLAQTEDQSRA
jgi:DNA-binding GntR family transcriptional regulator